MDQEGKRWIMKIFSRYPKALLLISHDMALMDTAIDGVVYVNPHTHTTEVYTGNYSSFRHQQKQAEELLKRKVEIESQKIRHLEKSLTKIARYSSEKGVRVKTRLRHKLEEAKAKLPSLPVDVQSIKISLPLPTRVGEIPVIARSISKRYGDYTVFENLDFSIRRGEKMALLGPNGAGKTTLIKTLLGIEPIDSGEVKRVFNAKIGYYSQEMETFEMDAKVLDYFCHIVERMDTFARPFLGKFGIGGNKVFQKVSSLSGGEKTRLSIAVLCAQPFNMLILDEPTTYLDVMSQRVILEALKSYTGTLLLVSHTEQFVKELKPSKVYLMPEQKMEYWDDKYLDRVGEI
jgi:ATPase subunit of ABC transporter with duplicated ATPase domains